MFIKGAISCKFKRLTDYILKKSSIFVIVGDVDNRLITTSGPCILQKFPNML